MTLGWGRVSVVVLGLLLACGESSTPQGDESSSDGTGSATQSSADSSPSTTASSTAGPTTANPSTTASTSTTDPDTGMMSGESGDGETGLPDDVEVIELRAGGFQPPVTETFYSCFSFTMDFDSLRHIVGFRPAVTSPIVHHYVLSLADGEVNLDPSDSCFEWPAAILWAWAPGIEETLLPSEAGFLIGDAPAGRHTFVLQVHYNNPAETPYTDNDGIDVLVTPTLRPNPAAILSQGDIYSIQVPPGNPMFEYTAVCAGNQTASMLPEPIHVFSSFLHAHEIGAAMWTDVIRDGNVVGQVASQDPFDFNQQQFHDADITIQPGDRIETTCIYDSTGRMGFTSGGPASDEEMCINFMMYYPAIPSEKCGLL